MVHGYVNQFYNATSCGKSPCREQKSRINFKGIHDVPGVNNINILIYCTINLMF